MHPVIAKTFGGLTKAYYIRQFMFGLIFTLLLFFFLMNAKSKASLPITIYIMIIVDTLLYPYAHFAYETIIDYIMGNNTFFVDAKFMLIVKLLTMAICFCFALFKAPIGLAFIYFQQSKTAS